MGTDLLINLALGDIEARAGVMPADRAASAKLEQLVAVWCEAEPSRTLYQVIEDARPVARELKRPLAIYTPVARFDLSIVGVCLNSDQWWMACDRHPDEPIDLAIGRYEDEVHYCPLGRVVLVVGLADWLSEDLAAYVRACGDFARRRSEIVGLVWIGRPAVEAVGDVTAEDLAALPGPPPVEAVESFSWR